MPPHPPPPTPPRLLAGRYLLLDEIGAGAMGTVHRAWDLRERREVAAKRLRGGGGGGEALLRFVREQALRVDHPHVLAPVGWAAEDDEVALVSPLVRGGSLEGLLRRCGPLSAPYVARLLAQLLAALAAVHAQGLVHRDVKPANLLLEPTRTAPPHLRLADFGVATALADGLRLTRVPGEVGTAGYVPPECRDGAPPDPRQDLYAAGVVARRALGPERRHLGLEGLVSALVDPHPARRPPDAASALARLHDAIDLDAPWDPALAPDVTDVLGATTGVPRHLVVGPPDERSERAAWVSAACLAGSAVLSLAGAGVLVGGRVLGGVG